MAHEFVRHVPEIGMFAFSRGRATCKWKTPWCKKNCYAQKFYRMGWAKDEYDKLDDDWWIAHDGIEIAKEIREKASTAHFSGQCLPPNRFRFSIKGEIWTHPTDVLKVQMIAQELPSTRFWIPTRAWHDEEMVACIEQYIFPHQNLHVLASIDPSDTEEQIVWLRDRYWSLVFAGDNDPDQMLLTEDGAKDNPVAHMYRCRKTWEELSGHCLLCMQGCFSSDQTEVHLKKHK